MQRQLKIDIDWTALQPYLAKARDGEIGYVKALERYRIPLDKCVLQQTDADVHRILVVSLSLCGLGTMKLCVTVYCCKEWCKMQK